MSTTPTTTDSGGDVRFPGEIHTFEPMTSIPAMHPVGIDGPDVRCAFETSWCKNRVTLAGGLDEHHRWPKSLGGPDEPTDRDGLLYLCPIHHRRQHALIRAMVEHGTTVIRTVRHFTDAELATAAYAVGQWAAIGRPRIAGWPTPAARLRVAA